MHRMIEDLAAVQLFWVFYIYRTTRNGAAPLLVYMPEIAEILYSYEPVCY